MKTRDDRMIDANIAFIRRMYNETCKDNNNIIRLKDKNKKKEKKEKKITL